MDDTQLATENFEQQMQLTGPELDLTQRLAIIGGHPRLQPKIQTTIFEMVVVV